MTTNVAVDTLSWGEQRQLTLVLAVGAVVQEHLGSVHNSATRDEKDGTSCWWRGTIDVSWAE